MPGSWILSGKVLSNQFLLVQLNGRGNTFYDGVGEVDFFDVLDDLRKTFLIDTTHLFLEGVSMGGTAAFRLGIRHPDIFAGVAGDDGWSDYRYWYPQWYGPKRLPNAVASFRLANLAQASPTSVAENAMWQHCLLEVDTGDTTVWAQNGIGLNARLNTLGASAPTQIYLHQLSTTTGGHGAGYNQQAIYNYFLSLPGISTPAEVIFKTLRLKDGKMYWVSIDRLLQWNVMAGIDAKIMNNTVQVTTTNVQQFTLTLTSRMFNNTDLINITVNGVDSYSGGAQQVTLYAVQNSMGKVIRWSSAAYTPNGLVKKAGLEGPIGDGYNTKFLVVYGNATDLTEAQSFCANWNQWMSASIVPHTVASVTTAQMTTCNLILFGTADSNSLIATMQPSLPIKVTNSVITVGNTKYTGTNYGVYFIYPNPQNPQRYVVVSHKLVPGAKPKDLEALPWYWPDYVIFDTNKSAGLCIQASLNYLPDSFVTAGYFDAFWRIP